VIAYLEESLCACNAWRYLKHVDNSAHVKSRPNVSPESDGFSEIKIETVLSTSRRPEVY